MYLFIYICDDSVRFSYTLIYICAESGILKMLDVNFLNRHCELPFCSLK